MPRPRKRTRKPRIENNPWMRSKRNDKGNWIVLIDQRPDGKPGTKGAGRGVKFAYEYEADNWIRDELQYIREECHRIPNTDLVPDWTPPDERHRKQVQGGVTLAEYMDEYYTRKLESGAHKETTHAQLVNQMERRVTRQGFCPPEVLRLGTLPVNKITPDDTAQWWAAVTATWPDKKRANNIAYTQLRTIMKDAEERGLIDSNPFNDKEAARKPPAQKERVFLTRDEQKAILDNIAPQYRVFIVCTLFLGLRAGEAIGLRLESVKDTDEGMILCVRDQMQLIPRVKAVEAHWTPQTTKTSSGVRDVPVFDHLIPLFREHIAQRVADGAKPSDPLTVNVEGTLPTRQKLDKALQAAKKRAGIEKRVHFHMGRHTVATQVYDQNMGVKDAMAVLGDKDPGVILEVYEQADRNRIAQKLRQLGKLHEQTAAARQDKERTDEE